MRPHHLDGDETPSSVQFGFGLEPPPSEPQTLAVELASREAAAISASLERQAEITRSITDVHGRWRSALIARVGEASWREMMEFSRERRRAEPSSQRAAPLDPQAMERARGRSQDASREILQRVGVKREDLMRINASHAAELELLAAPAPSQGTLELVPEEQVPTDVKQGKGNPWTIYTPPFPGWWWSYSWWRFGGKDPELYYYVNPGSGAIGHRSDWYDYSASDLDGFYLDYNTQLGVWYKPSSAGRLDVWFRLQCASARSHIWLDDEWGWSDSHTRMWSHLTVNVSPVLADQDSMQIWWAWAKGNPNSKTYLNDWYTPGQALWFNMKTSAPVPANIWTLVKVGTYDKRYTWLNDVSTWQMMRNRWFVESLWIDVV
jgi:hypothetical protein